MPSVLSPFLHKLTHTRVSRSLSKCLLANGIDRTTVFQNVLHNHYSSSLLLFVVNYGEAPKEVGIKKAWPMFFFFFLQLRSLFFWKDEGSLLLSLELGRVSNPSTLAIAWVAHTPLVLPEERPPQIKSPNWAAKRKSTIKTVQVLSCPSFAHCSRGKNSSTNSKAARRIAKMQGQKNARKTRTDVSRPLWKASVALKRYANLQVTCTLYYEYLPRKKEKSTIGSESGNNKNLFKRFYILWYCWRLISIDTPIEVVTGQR